MAVVNLTADVPRIHGVSKELSGCAFALSNNQWCITERHAGVLPLSNSFGTIYRPQMDGRSLALGMTSKSRKI